MRNQLTYEEAHRLMEYNPETGVLTRKVSLVYSTPVGSEAGSLHNISGYIGVSVNGIRYQSHRVIWLMMTGKWPKSTIDHIDCDKTNNRWSNLREASVAENNQNKTLICNNSSGLRGVSWYKKSGKWKAQIGVNKRMIFLGYFEDKFEAQEAYLKAKREMHPFFASTLK